MIPSREVRPLAETAEQSVACDPVLPRRLGGYPSWLPRAGAGHPGSSVPAASRKRNQDPSMTASGLPGSVRFTQPGRQLVPGVARGKEAPGTTHERRFDPDEHHRTTNTTVGAQGSHSRRATAEDRAPHSHHRAHTFSRTDAAVDEHENRHGRITGEAPSSNIPGLFASSVSRMCWDPFAEGLERAGP